MSLFSEYRGIRYSIAMHVVALFVAFFGLPRLVNTPEPEPFVVSIEVVAVGPKTNIPKQQKPLVREDKKPKPKPKPQIIEKEVPPPPQEKKPDPEPAPKEEPQKKKETLDDIMKRLEEEAAQRKDDESEKEEDEDAAEKNTSRSDAEYDDSLPLALSEKDAIRSQFVRCWRMPAGARDAHTLAVRVFVEVNPDGSVKTAELADGQSSRYRSDRFFKAAADSAIRAVRKCSPLKNLPADKYGSWREMELNFDPKELYF